MTKPNTTNSELDKILAEHWSDLRVVESGSPGTRSNAHRKAKRRLEALIAARVIDELKQIEPPEQYKEYAKLLGRDACNICGFNAVKFREYIQERIADLQPR